MTVKIADMPCENGLLLPNFYRVSPGLLQVVIPFYLFIFLEP